MTVNTDDGRAYKLCERWTYDPTTRRTTLVQVQVPDLDRWQLDGDRIRELYEPSTEHEKRVKINIRELTGTRMPERVDFL